MKKLFIAPSIRIKQVKKTNIICTSTIGYAGNDRGSATAESRNGWDWDDDDDF